MPARLGAEYIAEDGSRQVPIMLHRAIFGSMERFIGIVLEHYAEQLPLWLAPIQLAILTITDKQQPVAEKMAMCLENNGFRVNLDLRNEKIGFKIREHTLKRTPYLLVMGDREVETETISVRQRDGEVIGNLSLTQLLQHLRAEVEKKQKLRKQVEEI